jgi:hypothetical protein
MGRMMTTRQRRVIANCVRTAATENRRFPLTDEQLSDLVSAVESGNANEEQLEAAAIVAAFAPMSQPEVSSSDWRILSRALSRFDFDHLEPHPHWRGLVQHHLCIGAYAK